MAGEDIELCALGSLRLIGVSALVTVAKIPIEEGLMANHQGQKPLLVRQDSSASARLPPFQLATQTPLRQTNKVTPEVSGRNGITIHPGLNHSTDGEQPSTTTN